MRQKILLMFITLMLATPIFGQNNYTKRVAILETVDKEGEISYAVKLMIRSNLAQAITATSDYEGYDRVDVSSIINEHEFQRTGLVSDQQIKRLGEMNGAQYILIAEAAMLDNQNLYIAAKIINIESAMIEKTATIQSAISAVDLQRMSKIMAEDLFKNKFELLRTFKNKKNKKVAILEIVNRANEINYGIKFMIRSNIAWAITSTPGYEGYDRIDVSSIIKEHEFQRTGLVSDQQIKRLGEMTGAQYILITEVARVDRNTLFLTANILDVETAKIEKSANIQSGILLEEIKEASVTLAKELLEWQELSGGVIATNDMSAKDFIGEAQIAYNKGNYDLAFELTERAAKMGLRQAVIQLGYYYRKGIGVKRDFKKAIACYESVRYIPGIADCVIAEFNQCIPNYTIALEKFNLLKKYASHKRAIHTLADLGNYMRKWYSYYKIDKKQVPQDDIFKYIIAAAEDGYDKAQYYLAICYKEGFGTKKDNKQAKYWLQKASEQGHKEAYKMLTEF